MGPAGPATIETEVLIVGGGPTGQATAVELGRRGVGCLVVEPRETVSHGRPRAKTTSVRTMEHLRRWGLARRVREVAHLPVGWSQDIVFCVTLVGPEVTRFHGCFGLSTQRQELFAETSQQIPQPLVEEVLREAVDALEPCSVALGWRLEALEERDAGIRASIVDEAGERRAVVARYAVGCDGAGSRTRAAIGARYVGSSDRRPNVTFVFSTPDLEAVPHGPAIQYWTLDPEAPAYMGRLDLGTTWWIGLIGVDAERGAIDPPALIDRAVGRPIDVEVLSIDPWTQRMLQADRYAGARVFLAGDAAHLNPPWGGHGFNTGIGDAVNIGWKLGAVLEGWGGPGLLDSYEPERRPVAQRTIDEAKRHTGLLSADFADPRLATAGPEGDAIRRRAAEEIQRAKYSEFHGLGLVLGYSYGDSPVVVDDGSPPAPVEVDSYSPTARPGSRLPHLWMDDHRSLYDALGPGLSLLRLTAAADPGPLVRAARDRHVPLTVVDLADRGLAERYGAPLVLVRPDQHVAWRGDGSSREPDVVLDRVCGRGPRL